MKTLRITFAILLWVGAVLEAQDATGIKAANIKGADLKLMLNHDPEVERANFDLLPGYEVNLFAAEPMLANPIHMVWDSRGRLWVACSWAYPQLKPGEVANDKIIILEDMDGDGSADKSTVFAEGLYMPTGIELSNGGCYVAQTPDVFFLKDTDGDDVADVKELALTGFGIEDSHHSISAWRRGPGGWLYFQEGIFLHSQIETQHGMVRNYNGGVYQFNPRTQELRMFARIGVGNPWGHVIDRWGQSFFIDNPRVSYLSPSTGNSGEKVPLARLIQTEKQCGGDLASGTHLPAEIRGQLLTGRFKSRTVVRYEFLEDGAGFSANVLPPLIASKHPNFRPVDVKMGPDGAVYVADWYNSIINHAQHDFRDPRRDHEHGRIWRITAKDRPLVKKASLAKASIPDLLDQLESPEGWIRHQARLELGGKDLDAVVVALENWVDGLKVDAPEHDHHLVEALWACQNVDRVSEKILTKVLGAKDGRARAAGARVIRYWHAKLTDPVALIAKLAGDPFARVRMEAILSAGYIPEAEAFPAVLHALDHPRDKFIEIALPQTVAALEPYWRPALAAGTLEFAKDEHRAFALGGTGSDFAIRFGSFLKNGNPSFAETREFARLLESHANARQIKRLVAYMLKARLDNECFLELVEALARIGRAGQVKAGAHLEPFRRYIHRNTVDPELFELMAAWKKREWIPAPVGSPSRGLWDEKDIAWARAVGEIGAEKHLEAEFRRTLNLNKDPGGDSQYLAVLGLAVHDQESAVPLVAKLFGEKPTGSADPVVILKEYLQRSNGAEGLARALQGTTVDPMVREKILVYHHRTGVLPSVLLPRFETEPAPLTVSLLQEDRDALVLDVTGKGDPARGEVIYRRRGLACMSCHAIGGAGPEIGPNLAAVGAATTPSYIVEAILEPNKSIAEHYDTSLITLKDGGLHTGVVTFRSRREVVIRDSSQSGREVRISKGRIAKMQSLPSLMPAGLVDTLKDRQEFLDLANFVSQLGRPGPYANDERPVVRRWIGDEEHYYSTVSGELPLDELPVQEANDSNFGSATFEVEVLVAGKVELKISNREGLVVYRRKPEQAAERLSEWSALDLQRGRHEFWLMRFAKHPARGRLQVEVVPAEGSQARVRPVGGK